MSTRWNPFTKQVIFVGILVACAWLLLNERVLLEPVVLALLLAYLMSFPLRWVMRHTAWPRTMVVAFLYLLLIVIIITAPVLILPRLVALLGAFGATLLKVVQGLTTAPAPQPIMITPSLDLDPGIVLMPITQWLKGVLEPNLNAPPSLQSLLFPFASGAAIVVRQAVSSVVWIFFVLVISFYVAKDGPSMRRWLLSRMPEAFEPELQRLGSEMATVWDAFVRGQVTLAIVMGLVVWMATTILGIRSAPALGLISGLAEFLPGVGPIVAAGVGILIALMLGSSWLPLRNEWFAVLVALVYFLTSQVENMYVVPRVVGRRIALHPVVVIVGALAGAQIGGALGLMLAAPVIASIRVLFGYAVHKLLDEEPFPAAPTPPDRATLWQTLARERPICAILFDLDGTLIEGDNATVARLVQTLSFVGRLFPKADLARLARRLLVYGNLLANQVVMLLLFLRLYRLLVHYDEPLRSLRAICAPSTYVPMPGSLEILRGLSRRFRLAVVTTRPRSETVAFLNQYGINGLFRSVVTRDDVRRLEPHPMAMVLAARQLGVPPAQCVMVGDTSLDVRAARGAGMLCIGVLSGFGEESDLSDADLLLGSVAKLDAWL